MLNYLCSLFCADSSIFYFTEPGSVFFTNLIFLHDEICFFLIWILTFTYWMLYNILKDHIYSINSIINNSHLNAQNKFSYGAFAADYWFYIVNCI